MEEEAAERARREGRRARREDLGDIRRQPRHLRRPKVFAELRHSGESTSHKRVARIMRENGWVGTTRGCAKRPKGEAKAAAPQANSTPDLVRREFSADGPNRAWFADITYVRTHQGWLYLAVVMDIWSRMIVGWSMSDRMTAGLVIPSI